MRRRESLPDLIRHWLWQERKKSVAGAIGLCLQAVRVAWLSVDNALNNRIPFQASALTFVTLLGMVPALALIFALAKGFGFAENLRGVLLESLSDYQREILDRIFEYVENTKVGTLGAIGLVLFIATIVTNISTVEDTFNHIWQVKQQRPWRRRITDYLSILVIVPLLVLAGSVMWAAVSSNAIISWLQDVAVVGDLTRLLMRFVPLFALCAAFAFLYAYLPNTRVPASSAFVGGITAAVLWWIVQTIYIKFQVGVAKYNAIYGGFASLPLFMAWLQLCWTIVLFGAEVAHAHHLCRPGRLLAKRTGPTPFETEIVALRLMEYVCMRFDRGEKAPDIEEVAAKVGVSPATTESIVEALAKAGLLANEKERTLRPARSLDRISVADVIAAVRGGPVAKTGDGQLEVLLFSAEQQRLRSLERVTFLDIVRGR